MAPVVVDNCLEQAQESFEHHFRGVTKMIPRNEPRVLIGLSQTCLTSQSLPDLIPFFRLLFLVRDLRLSCKNFP